MLCAAREFLLVTGSLSGIFVGLYPFFRMRSFSRKFDKDLWNEHYWAMDVMRTYFFARFLRVMMYVGAIGSPWLARRKFPGYDLRTQVDRFTIRICQLYFVCFLYFVFAIIVFYPFKNSCS